MGFRFHKYIKLGKGLGLNISKRGIKPSYRSKIGSISAKGFSIRTGISGLNYRRNFSKRGCLVFVFIPLFISITVFISCDGEEIYVSPINNRKVILRS